MRGYFKLSSDQHASSHDPLCDSFFSQELDFDPFSEGNWTEELVWVEHEQELREFSKQFPTVVFTLTVEDKYGDLYRDYYKNGRMYSVEGYVTFEEFDEDNLE